MEHLAFEIGMDPLEFRMKNMISEGERLFTKPFKLLEPNPLPDIIGILKSTANYDQRLQQVADFNAKNKWKKKGMSLVPTLYTQNQSGTSYYFMLSIYATDGTVSISHGGVELGNVRKA